jgi:DNA-binding transcriptional LysR family regulator
MGLARRIKVTLPHLMAMPEILRSTDLVAAVPSRAAARFGAGLITFDLDFLGLSPWTLHMLWSPFARRDAAHTWLRETMVSFCTGFEAGRA